MAVTILSNVLGEVGMRDAVTSLKRGDALLDVIEAGIKLVEADPNVPYVGIGGDPNLLGELEVDGAIMDGDTLRVGVVGALKGYASAIWVARQVLEVLPHTMIVGEGASLFAAERGAQKLDSLPEKVLADYQAWFEKNVPQELVNNWPNVELAPFTWPKPDPKDPKDTVVYLARNAQGQIAGGTSTSGWSYKYPGRLGDSPIIGAGLYADSEFGACACTHTGEMTMRAGTARSVIAYMKAGASVKDACHEAVSDLRRIKGGYRGPVVIHAIDRQGEPYVVATKDQNLVYWIWTEGSDQIKSVKAELDLMDFD